MNTQANKECKKPHKVSTLSQHPLFIIHYSLFILTIYLLLVGCINPFNPEIKGGSRPTGLANNTPDNVLRNLMSAYNQKDIELYKHCLSDDFRFYVATVQIPEIGNDWWGYEQEIEYHNRLFSYGSRDGGYPSPNIISLTLDIPPDMMWEINSDGVVIIACPFYLMLNYSTIPDIVATGYARFHLKQVGQGWFISVWVDESYI